MQLFFNPDIDKHTTKITFNKTESKHIIRVLRKKEGDTISITNGKGLLFKCKIISDDIKKCSVSIVSKEEKKQSRNYYLHIAIAPTKNISRLEWFLEKATEIGIDEITPIICQNSERKVIKFERLEKIVVSAMKQSLKFHLPKLNKPIYFDDFLERKQQGKVCIAHCEKGEKKLLKSIVSPKESVTILIGPEGDFSALEISKSVDTNCIPITLGKTRLRSETAALVSVQNISFINQ
ncbi:MAG: Ribosomal RNA small subunit methyltransferase E [Flavobacterium sp. SCGC AAA160-P02]|nr:MAG: Ribosomal RNA small subunit methyltransferase E [Flavobacterium sp. SCGC AAA160-P02]